MTDAVARLRAQIQRYRKDPKVILLGLSGLAVDVDTLLDLVGDVLTKNGDLQRRVAALEQRMNQP
jgi:hypothetical protein